MIPAATMLNLPLTIGDKVLERLTRPPAAQSDPLVFWNNELYTFLQAQGDRYRSAPIYLDAASTVAHFWDKPIVAGRSMCAAPAVDGGYANQSPNALIRDKTSDLRITATGALSTNPLTTGTPNGTLAISALDRALQAGFVLEFPGGYVKLTANASAGATSLSLRRINADVSISATHVGIARNGYFYQRGSGCPQVNNVVLCGDPNPLMDDPRHNENSRKFACDGIAVNAMGGHYDKVICFNFPGHGMFIGSNTAFSTLEMRFAPWDIIEVHLGYVSVLNCLTGVTLTASDSQFDSITAAGCRDYGTRLHGPNVQGKTIHSWGCQLAHWSDLGGRAEHIEAESSDYGANIFGKSEQGVIKAWSNWYRALLFDGYETSFKAIHADQDNYATTGAADPTGGVYPTGYAVVFRGFNDNVVCPAMIVKGRNGASGFCFGQDNNHNNEGNQLVGSIIGDGSGSYGLDLRQHLVGSNFSFNVNGFIDEVYIRDGVTLFGNKLDFYGTSNSTVRWPGESAGVRHSFSSPGIPNTAQAASPSGFVTGIASSNNITFHVY